MPWRGIHNPYYTWISEIMLQQTRVEAATDYFLRFVKALPTVSDLANVPDEQLMKLWEGLGYYSRARNLKKAAQILCRDYGGALPADHTALMNLPGIGSYTAGAICSIAFDLPYPAVDGNVLRVVSRLTGCRADIAEAKVKKEWEITLAAVYPKSRAGDFTQSLMELGAIVCLPNGAPRCENCPLGGICQAKANDTIDLLPVKAPKKERKVEKHTVFILLADNKVALRKRPESGLLAGLWELPMKDGCLSREEVASWFEQQQTAAKISALKPAKHIFSHVEWRMSGYLVQLEVPLNDPSLVWVDKPALEGSFALPSAFKAYRKLLGDLL